MSRLRANQITNKTANGAPTATNGLIVTGVCTATSFVGSGANLTGIDATAIKHTDGSVKAQAVAGGVNITGDVSVSGALGVAGVGMAAKALLDKKRKEAKEKKQNKKMGGGMMKTPGYKKGKGVMIMIAVGKPKKKMGGGLAAATERLKAQGKMGGGMMKPQKAVLGMLFRKKKKATPGMKMVESSPGGFGLLGRLAKKVGLQKGGGADTGRIGEIKSRLAVATQKLGKLPGRRLTSKDLERLKKLKPMKPLKKIGGGMMQPVMPMYKKGTMIKARGGGLAKTKPTKMY